MRNFINIITESDNKKRLYSLEEIDEIVGEYQKITIDSNDGVITGTLHGVTNDGKIILVMDNDDKIEVPFDGSKVFVNEGVIKKPMTPSERQASIKDKAPTEEPEFSPEEQETIDKGKEGEKILKQKGVLREEDGSLGLFISNYCAENKLNFITDLMDLYITENMNCSEEDVVGMIKTVTEESSRFPSNQYEIIISTPVYEIFKLPEGWNFQYGYRILQPRSPEHDGYEGKCYSLDRCKQELIDMGY